MSALLAPQPSPALERNLDLPLPTAPQRCIAAPVMRPVEEVCTEAALAAAWQKALHCKMVEISGQAGTAWHSCAVDLLVHAQRRGETVAWIQPEGGGLYPPDLAQAGADLQALVVVHVPPATGLYGIPRAAELLLRSGGYGVVVLDLLAGVPTRQSAWQSRLLGLCRQHHGCVVVLTQKSDQDASLGPWISWRLQPKRHRQLRDGLFLIEPRILKNKVGVPWPQPVLRRCGPPGVF